MVVVHSIRQRVHRPRERLRAQRTGHLSRPVVVGRVRRAVQRVGVRGERLRDQPVELIAEAVLEVDRVDGRAHRVPLALPPLGATILEPDLETEVHVECERRKSRGGEKIARSLSRVCTLSLHHDGKRPEIKGRNEESFHRSGFFGWVREEGFQVSPFW